MERFSAKPLQITKYHLLQILLLQILELEEEVKKQQQR